MKIKLIQKSPFVWFVFIIFVLVFGFVYAILMKPMGILYNHDFDDPLLQSDQVYQSFYIRSKTIWDWFPLVVAIVMIYWAIIKIHQRSDFGGY